MFYLVSSITIKTLEKKSFRKIFLGVIKLYFLWEKRQKSPKISCFFKHIPVTKRDISIIKKNADPNNTLLHF